MKSKIKKKIVEFLRDMAQWEYHNARTEHGDTALGG